jgi:hypothetical protein
MGSENDGGERRDRERKADHGEKGTELKDKPLIALV